MKKIVVTGGNGFIARNLIDHLSRSESYQPISITRDDSDEAIRMKLSEADLVFHLAGVNRPKDTSEFTSGNVAFTSQICDFLQQLNRQTSIIFSSTTQAELDNEYGNSKRAAEQCIIAYAESSGSRAAIYRLPGVFGKWSRPNYNTVVATFCHNIARNLPITISNAEHQLTLAYIDDVVATFLVEAEIALASQNASEGLKWLEIEPTYQVKLGDLAERIRSFKKGRETNYSPDFTDSFVHKLYATYLSFLDSEQFSYDLQQHSDPRGSLAEFIKFSSFGQIFVSRTKPGITRGNHYHHTKTEKFLVLEGEANIRFRQLSSGEVIEYPVRGPNYTVIDIPPGYTHSIENTGDTDLVTLFWASEVFAPEAPDTYYIPVLQN